MIKIPSQDILPKLFFLYSQKCRENDRGGIISPGAASQKIRESSERRAMKRIIFCKNG